MTSKSLLEIVSIQPTKAQPTVGSGLGFIVQVKNQSEETVFITWDTTVLVVPPELLYPFAQRTDVWHATFATELKHSPNETIGIKPGDSYILFWTPSPPEIENMATSAGVFSTLKVIITEVGFLFFSPANYEVSVIIKQWTNAKEVGGDNYRLVTKSASIPVAAPNIVIMIGAAIGGILAFYWLRVSKKDGEGIPITALATSGTFLRCILLAVIVTILLSRIADTKFFIQITVNDVWGAIAMGFLANLLGTKLLEKLL
ncbi:MAG: hypothetical protein NTNFB01_20880 [Nitrospira sp.]